MVDRGQIENFNRIVKNYNANDYVHRSWGRGRSDLRRSRLVGLPVRFSSQIELGGVDVMIGRSVLFFESSLKRPQVWKKCLSAISCVELLRCTAATDQPTRCKLTAAAKLNNVARVSFFRY